MIRLPTRSTRTDTLFPYATLFRSEKQVEARDPDYAIKHPMILDRIRAVVLSPGGKRPASPDEAVALAKRAYDDVTAYLTKIRPAKLEVRPTPSGASVTPAAKRSEQRREGNECVSTGRSRGAPYH